MNTLVKLVLPTVFPIHVTATLFSQVPEQKSLGYSCLARMKSTFSPSVLNNSFGSTFKIN